MRSTLTSAHASPSRVNILGVGVHPINMSMALTQIDDWIRTRDGCHYVCVTGVHGVIESQHSQPLRRIHNQAGLVTPDGMPLVWVCRSQGYPQVERVYGPDLMLAVCEQGLQAGYRHYFFGGA